MKGMWAKSLGQEDPLQKEMATHSSILAWEIIWTEEPDYSPWSCKSVRHYLAIKQYRCIYFKYSSVYMYSVYLHVPVHPTPAFFLLVTISLFSKSIALHFLDKSFSLLKSFLFNHFKIQLLDSYYLWFSFRSWENLVHYFFFSSCNYNNLFNIRMTSHPDNHDVFASPMFIAALFKIAKT